MAESAFISSGLAYRQYVFSEIRVPRWSRISSRTRCRPVTGAASANAGVVDEAATSTVRLWTAPRARPLRSYAQAVILTWESGAEVWLTARTCHVPGSACTCRGSQLLREP